VQGFNIGELTWIQGLKIVAVAVVAHAILGMAQKLTPDLPRRTIALVAIALPLLWQTIFAQVGIIILSGFVGYLIYKEHKEDVESKLPISISPAFAYGCLILFFGLLIILPFLREATSIEWIAMFDSFLK
jgi:chromate transporter